MDKKAQGISLTVIIIAIIALVVLIILVTMFVTKMAWWGPKATIPRCEKTCFVNSAGAKVFGEVVTGAECPENYHMAAGAYNDVGPGQLCCINDMTETDELGCE